MSDIDGHPDFPRRRAGSGWGWWVSLGILLVVAGAVAFGNLLIATSASVLVVGAMMILGGVAQIVFAFPVRRRWGRFALWLLLGVLYLVAGDVTLRNPVLATTVLTLVLAASMIAVRPRDATLTHT